MSMILQPLRPLGGRGGSLSLVLGDLNVSPGAILQNVSSKMTCLIILECPA